MRTSAKARSRNRHYRLMMKKAVRKVREASTADEARTALHDASSVLDRLAGKGIIHRNRAADRKARLHRFVRTLEA